MKSLGLLCVLLLVSTSLAGRIRRQASADEPPPIPDIQPDGPSEVDPPVQPVDPPVQPVDPPVEQPVDPPVEQPVDPPVEQPVDPQPDVEPPVDVCQAPVPEDCESAAAIGDIMSYMSDPCDIKRFYQCVKDETGSWVMEHMICGPCTLWDQSALTCALESEECPDESVIEPELVETEPDEMGIFFCKRRGFIAKPIIFDYGYYQYIKNQNTWLARPCPYGTRFTLALCGCTHCSCNYPEDTSRTSCLSFEKGWDNLGTSDGTYVGLVPAGGSAPVVSPGADGTAQAGLFDGSTNLRSWRYGATEWQSFDVSFWYKQKVGGFRQGILCNGNLWNKPTFVISTTGLLFKSLSIKVGFSIDRKFPPKFSEITIPNCVDLNWHKLRVTYNGYFMEAFLDGNSAGSAIAFGTVYFPSPPLIIGAMAFKNDENTFNHYRGLLDEICINYGP